MSISNSVGGTWFEAWARLTVFGILSGDISNGVADLVPHGTVGLVGQGLQELLADDGLLLGAQRDEYLDSFSLVILATLGGYPAKDDGGEGS